MLIGGSFQLPTAFGTGNDCCSASATGSAFLPASSAQVRLDLGLGFDLGLRFGLGHCRLGAPIGGLFALGRIIEETPECSAEQGRDHPSTLGDKLPNRAGRRTRDDDDADHADGEQDHRCAGGIGKGVQDAPTASPRAPPAAPTSAIGSSRPGRPRKT